MDPVITLLEVHKLMYFLQQAGEPLKLRFVKAHYGPYAENLRHVLHAIEGHLISGYADGGDAPTKSLSIVPGAVRDAEAYLASHHSTHARFERVGRLVDGFETPFGLELLATVHWVVTQQGASGATQIKRAVHDWGPNKQQFSQDQIMLAESRLRNEGWIAAE